MHISRKKNTKYVSTLTIQTTLQLPLLPPLACTEENWTLRAQVCDEERRVVPVHRSSLGSLDSRGDRCGTGEVAQGMHWKLVPPPSSPLATRMHTGTRTRSNGTMTHSVSYAYTPLYSYQLPWAPPDPHLHCRRISLSLSLSCMKVINPRTSVRKSYRWTTGPSKKHSDLLRKTFIFN
jgi:hypothetical protein